ncbi:MAG: hypothetical protein M1830_000671 [Pleopsidium flavum]|nr:MAG: hypothetical protein M1830_000671 [Pleopsidium flavum]
MKTPNRPDSEIARGVGTTDELYEFHPGPSKLSSFVIPSPGGLHLLSVTTYLAAQSLPLTTVISALDTELDRIHRKVGSMRFSKTGAKPPVLGVTDDGRELYGFFEQGASTLKRREYRLSKMARRQCEHVDTAQSFLKHFAKHSGLLHGAGDGIGGAMGEERGARSRALANRARHRRKKEPVRKKRNQMPGRRSSTLSSISISFLANLLITLTGLGKGQAEHARRPEFTKMKADWKKVHVRIEMGRRQETLTIEGARLLAETYSEKSQLEMLEERKEMVRQGIAVEVGMGLSRMW